MTKTEKFMSDAPCHYKADEACAWAAGYNACLAALPQSPSTGGKAFHQIAHDEGKPDLGALWQAVIDNTKGSGFWLGEILLTTIEQETGFNGAVTRPDRDGKSK